MYKPKPIDTSKIELPADLEALIERLAEHNHDVWAEQRIRDGWTYGSERNDARKEHPCLVPYSQLPETEKLYDRRTVEGIIKAMLHERFEIKRKNPAPQHQ